MELYTNSLYKNISGGWQVNRLVGATTATTKAKEIVQLQCKASDFVGRSNVVTAYFKGKYRKPPFYEIRLRRIVGAGVELDEPNLTSAEPFIRLDTDKEIIIGNSYRLIGFVNAKVYKNRIKMTFEDAFEPFSADVLIFIIER